MSFQGSDALPGNASELERAMADLDWDRLSDVDISVISSVTDPMTCPTALLPWLAWAMSVDSWDPTWSEATKRSVIAAAPAVHRLKGTRRAVRLALEALGVDIDIDEWWETSPERRRGTFRVTAWADGAPLIDLSMITAMRNAIRGAKPKARVGELRIGLRANGPVFAGGAGQTLVKTRVFLETGL